jgi:hypothetical protein
MAFDVVKESAEDDCPALDITPADAYRRPDNVRRLAVSDVVTKLVAFALVWDGPAEAGIRVSGASKSKDQSLKVTEIERPAYSSKSWVIQTVQGNKHLRGWSPQSSFNDVGFPRVGVQS